FWVVALEEAVSFYYFDAFSFAEATYLN
ncbi:hypothetical protein LCGC14_2396490, partial [marine sediment metagenome]